MTPVEAPSISAGRRCASGADCPHRVRIEAGGRLLWVGELLGRPRGLCPLCWCRARRAIEELPRDVFELSAVIGTGGGRPGERVSRSRELPLLIRTGVEALRAAIDYETVYWAEVLGMETPTAVRLEARVGRASRWVAVRLDRLLEAGPSERAVFDPWGASERDESGYRVWEARDGLSGALRLVQLHARVRLVVGRTKLVHRLTPACPFCDQRALVRHNGRSEVECEGCGKKIPEQLYDWFVRATVAEERRRQELVA